MMNGALFDAEVFQNCQPLVLDSVQYHHKIYKVMEESGGVDIFPSEFDDWRSVLLCDLEAAWCFFSASNSPTVVLIGF